jgi:hypothetical protein
MAVNPFLRGMTGQQMGVGRRSAADFFMQQASPSMALPVRRPTPPQRLSAAPTQPLDIAGLRRQVLAQSAAPTAPQSRQALMAKYGLAPTAPAPKPSPMQRLSAALPASGTPQMAGLGAAGRAMLEMSGYQPIAQAPSIGQILARSAEAGIGAMEKKQALAEKKAKEEAALKAAAEQQTYEREQAAKELALDERRTAAAERTEIDELYAGAERLGLTGQDAIDFVMNQLAKKKGGTDVSVTIGPNGEKTMALDNSVIKKQQDAVLKAASTTDLLTDIQATYKPEFQEIPTRMQNLWLKYKDKFGSASDSEQESLRQFAEYKQNAMEAVNQYIRDITGAQMSVAEAERLSKALPQPGTGIFDGDSPAEFESKLKNAIRKVKLAEQRAKYFLSEGIDVSYNYEQTSSDVLDADFDTDARFKMNGKTISLNDMPRIINKKGAELEKQFIDEGMSIEDAQREVTIRLKEIFG